MSNKYFKGEIETFWVVLVLRYLRVYQKRSVDILRKKQIDYDIKEINYSEDVLMLIKKMKDPKTMLDFKNKLK